MPIPIFQKKCNESDDLLQKVERAFQEIEHLSIVQQKLLLNWATNLAVTCSRCVQTVLSGWKNGLKTLHDEFEFLKREQTHEIFMSTGRIQTLDSQVTRALDEIAYQLQKRGHKALRPMCLECTVPFRRKTVCEKGCRKLSSWLQKFNNSLPMLPLSQCGRQMPCPR